MPSLREFPDKALVDMVTGEPMRAQEAWKELMRRCKPVLMHIVRDSPFEADDLQSDLYIHLSDRKWRRLLQYQQRSQSTFCSWISAVARNLVCSRRRRTRLVTVSLDELDADGWYRSGRTEGPETAVVRMEQRMIVQASIPKLGARCQIIVRRRLFRGEPYEDIAADIGGRPNSICKLYKHNMQQLSKILDKAGILD